MDIGVSEFRMEKKKINKRERRGGKVSSKRMRFRESCRESGYRRE